MGDSGRTSVDLLTLEDFRDQLNVRAAAVDAMLKTYHDHVDCQRPALGVFDHANRSVQNHSAVAISHHKHLLRLKAAITAAQQGTDEILRNYRTTEDRNAASPKAIGAELARIPGTLKGT